MADCFLDQMQANNYRSSPYAVRITPSDGLRAILAQSDHKHAYSLQTMIACCLAGTSLPDVRRLCTSTNSR